MLEPKDICVYIPTYWDMEALKHNLKHTSRHGFGMLVLDGRYTDFPQIKNSDYSRDGTEPVCKMYGADYFRVEPCREQDKVNRAMQIAHQKGYKVFIMIGADAMLEGDTDEFLINLQREYEKILPDTPTIFHLETEERQPNAKWNNTGTRQPRIWINYHKMEVRNLHWLVYEKGKPDTEFMRPDMNVISGMKIIHDNTVRPKERDDIMTEYQNTNVVRERNVFKEKCIPKARENTRILQWNTGTDGSYEQARAKFLRMSPEYTHLMLCQKGYHPTKLQYQRMLNTLEAKNNIQDDIKVLTTFWKAGKNITLNPKNRIKTKFEYEAIKNLYSTKGIPPTTQKAPLIVVPFTMGPVTILEAQVIKELEAIGDAEDFATFVMQLGHRTFGDIGVRFTWKG